VPVSQWGISRRGSFDHLIRLEQDGRGNRHNARILEEGYFLPYIDILFSPFALSLFNILNFKLPVKISP